MLKEFFEKRKTAALVGAISLVTAYEFSQIYVPEVVQDRLSYRIKTLIIRLIQKTVI